MDVTGEALTERVLFVHAHPDDETISTGGTIATLVDRGAHVAVLTMTRGERGEVADPSLAHLEGDRDALASHRQEELAEALRALGVTQHLYLGASGARHVEQPPRRYEDSGMRWVTEMRAGPVEGVGPETLTGAPWNEVAADVMTAIATVQPTAIVSYDSDGGYGHPDHELAHSVAALGAEIVDVPFYAIIPRQRATDGDVVVDTRPVAARKRAALAAHRSQLALDGDDIIHSGGQRQPIDREEAFRLRVQAEPAPAWSWKRMSAGQRVALVASVVFAGVAVGVITTLTHQWRVTIGDAWVWVGVIAGLAVVAVMIAGLRLEHESRLPALAFAAGVYVPVTLFTLLGASGSVVVPANDPGWWWVVGSALVAAIGIAWPRFTTSRA